MIDVLKTQLQANWVKTRQLGDTWLPAQYAKEYLKLDDMIQQAPDQYTDLADHIRLVLSGEQIMSTDVSPDTRWAMTLSGGRISVSSVADLPTQVTGVMLPQEAIVVWLSPSGHFEAKYWSEAAYGTPGFVDKRLVVLASCIEESPAWLAHELQQGYYRAQVARAQTGTAIMRLAPSDLLAIKIRFHSVETRSSLTRRVIQLAANERERLRLETFRSGGEPEASLLLTGSTLEERLRQFDAYAVAQGWCGSGAFFVEAATRDPDSDLFIVRRVDGRSAKHPAKTLAPTVGKTVNATWRNWYWAGEPDSRAVFLNSLGSPGELPAHLIHRTIGTQLAANVPKSLEGFFPLPIPPFGALNELAAKQAPGLPVSDLARDFFPIIIRPTKSKERSETSKEPASTHRAAPLSDKDMTIFQGLADDAFRPYREIYRPLVAIRVTSDREPRGAYLFFGGDQFDEPDVERAKLEGLAARILPILHPRSELVEEATRSESLRRLSWLMHRIHGPLGRIASALEDLHGFAAAQPDIALMPIPNSETAERRARMPGRSESEFTFEARTSVIDRAIAEIRDVGEKIRRLRSAYGSPSFAPTSMSVVVSRCLDACSQQLPDLEINRQLPVKAVVQADCGQLEFALSEVCNNAVREVQAQNISTPRIDAAVWEEGGLAWLSIKDNALPAASSLPANPFAEDASSYAGTGQGSGLGLAVVHAVVKSMSGQCYLNKNQGLDGSPEDGVTFLACAPLADANHEGDSDV